MFNFIHGNFIPVSFSFFVIFRVKMSKSRRPPRPVAQCRHFLEEAEDASVSECIWTLSALEALRNALYKFKTYLLTYLLRVRVAVRVRDR